MFSLPHRGDRKPLTIKEQPQTGSAVQGATIQNVVAHMSNPNISEAEQEDWDFEVSLGYTMRP